MVIEFLDVWQNYIPLSIIVVGISVVVMAAIYQLGKALSDKKMSDWARYEVYQAFGSLIIIALVAIALQTTNTVLLLLVEQGVGGFQCSGGECTYTAYALNSSLQGRFDLPVQVTKTCTQHCHIEVAKSYLDATYDLVRHYAAAQLCMAGKLEFWAEMKVKFEPMKKWKLIGKVLSSRFMELTSEGIPLFSGCQLADQSYEAMIAYMLTLLGVIKSNWMMLNLVEHAIFPLFLVWGIILRILSFTRKLGGLLIAIAVTLYFFYPAVVILEGVMMSPGSNMLKLEFTQCPGEGSIYGKESPDGKWQTPLNFFMIKDAQGSTYGICPFVAWDVPKPGGVIDATAAITTWVLTQFIIMIYLVAMFVTALSPLLGGDVDIAGISRLL